MDWPQWEPFYQSIIADLGFFRPDDEAARDELAALLSDRPAPLDLLEARLRGRTAVVVGAGEPVDPATLPEGAVVVADKAVATFLDAGGAVDLVVTDLDGDVARQVELNASGVPVAVHAHGDNREAVKTWVPRFEGPLLGTTQVEPVEPLVNAGGFTDGDRACFLAAHFGATDLALAGFAFRSASGMKQRKLTWAERLIPLAGLPTRYL